MFFPIRVTGGKDKLRVKSTLSPHEFLSVRSFPTGSMQGFMAVSTCVRDKERPGIEIMQYENLTQN